VRYSPLCFTVTFSDSSKQFCYPYVIAFGFRE
jgi:hypothetical protein